MGSVMKTKATLLVICLLLQLNFSTAKSVTVHVAEAGTLSSLIAPNEKYKITDLTLSGNLNGTDIRFIREMAGRVYEGSTASDHYEKTDGILKNLDLSGANIVNGGDYYVSRYFERDPYIKYYTNKNSISSYMFFDCKLKTIILPNNITSIGDGAFGNTGLTSITIPNGVTTIGQAAFHVCPELASVTIPNSVTSIGNKAFSVCPELKNITIPNGVTTIEPMTFFECISLTSITIPNSVISIGEMAFYLCISLTDITIPSNVAYWGTQAFAECTGLTNVTIGNSVTSIGYNAFAGCTGLTEIHCKSFQPAALGSYISDNVKTTCKLYVPRGSYTAYSLAPGWSEFKNIIEEDVGAIDSIKNDKISIRSISNGICIDVKEIASIAVYNLSGQTVYQNIINGSAEIMLDKGVYIVRVNNESQKVIVR